MKNDQLSKNSVNSQTNKFVPLSECQKLKKIILDLKEKYEKVKNENVKLRNYLDEMGKNIQGFEESKKNIALMVKEVQEKYVKLNTEYQKMQNNKLNLQISNFEFNYIINSQSILNITNELNFLNNNYKELNEKYKNLKEEHNKCMLSKLCSTTNSTNLNTKNEIKLQNIKTNLIENYLCSINFGIDCSNVNEDEEGCIINSPSPCEPVPTLIKFLKKA